MNSERQDDQRIPKKRRTAYNWAKASWETEAIINKAAEEFAELSAALNRDLNGQQDADELVAKLADARLMLEQLEHSVFNTQAVDESIEQAEDDLIERLEEHGITFEGQFDE